MDPLNKEDLSSQDNVSLSSDLDEEKDRFAIQSSDRWNWHNEALFLGTSTTLLPIIFIKLQIQYYLSW